MDLEMFHTPQCTQQHCCAYEVPEATTATLPPTACPTHFQIFSREVEECSLGEGRGVEIDNTVGAPVTWVLITFRPLKTCYTH